MPADEKGETNYAAISSANGLCVLLKFALRNVVVIRVGERDSWRYLLGDSVRHSFLPELNPKLILPYF
ncbi:hypothetical protein A2671_01650 [Candidatus Kaiserbacteria bacterium RIFCSPHIGHO2_01_FULL_49_13]|uniref:Uncharacterized protein n=1 Tax=Candidatus Kaiserbacteria bacterium RIFCSPHIGHO2_01_FULL_49_13 TaxID=1798477 RepID=A0A1F6CF44_9BACT|nr:MAG: hypothetical protein A2671_01650 [Candidatus Kaiserbacteria bacterium RIFCSPHIGHO2_01_FULL_49_13]